MKNIYFIWMIAAWFITPSHGQNLIPPERFGVYTMCSKIYIGWTMPDSADTSKIKNYLLYHKFTGHDTWFYLMQIDRNEGEFILPKSEQEFLEQTYGEFWYTDMCLGISAVYDTGESAIAFSCQMGIADTWPEPPWWISAENTDDTTLVEWARGSPGCAQALYYEIYRRDNGSDWQVIDTVRIGQTFYYDIHPPAGNICYQVSLVSTQHNLRSYEEACVTTTNLRYPPIEAEESSGLLYKVDCYPSPFNPATRIRFTLSQQINVTITIYTILGQPLRVLLDKLMLPGQHEVIFDGQNLAGGLYIALIQTGKTDRTLKLILIR